MSKLERTEKATILVVDDTPDNLILMSSLLKGEYCVKVANSGEKALKIAVSDTPPNLILLDIMMPDMDGYEVCRRLKNNPETLGIPVIFLTAKVEMEDEKRGLELGAVDYITKPISPPIVMARVKNHLALQERNIELESAKSAAEKANLAKSSFLSSMSHELRSPLNAILGFAQLMESDATPPSPAQKESIAMILQAGWHLLQLINEILDLAKVESGQMAITYEAVSLADIMLECQAMIEPQAQQHHIQIIFPHCDSLWCVHADRIRVKQVLINLLSNAVKYNNPQGRVEVSCHRNTPERIRVSVKDCGAGLSAEQLAQLFQPFNRLGQETGSEEGTGIGLMISKRLVELMGGRIGVESIVGAGSVFWFELVAEDAPHQPVDANDTALLSTHATRTARLHTLLYVEDNPANLMLVEQIIARHADLHLLTAATGMSGIEIARASRPEVILMDINLPDISGIEALKTLREDPLTAHIPAIAVSANAMPADIDAGMRAGFLRYITKPIKVDEFVDALNVALALAEKNRVDTNHDQSN